MNDEPNVAMEILVVLVNIGAVITTVASVIGMMGR